MATLNERTREKIANADTLNDICCHVANGGALTDLCETWQVRFSDIAMWIYADPERANAYDAAMRSNTEWLVNKLLDELKKMATVDIRQAFNENGGLRPIHEIPKDVAGCIQSIESEELWEGRGENREQVGELRKVKFWDKLKSIELLGKKLALFIDRVEHSGKMTLEDLVSKSMGTVITVQPVQADTTKQELQLTSSETADDTTTRTSDDELPRPDDNHAG